MQTGVIARSGCCGRCVKRVAYQQVCAQSMVGVADASPDAYPLRFFEQMELPRFAPRQEFASSNHRIRDPSVRWCGRGRPRRCLLSRLGDTLIRRLDQMSIDEISALSKEFRHSSYDFCLFLRFEEALTGNPNTAVRLLELVSSISKMAGVRRPLIQFFEKWGKLRFDKARGTVRYSRNHNVGAWTDEYEAQIKTDRSIDPKNKETQPINSVWDADQEFRKVVSRLRQASQDPYRIILHSVLLSKVEEVLFAYGRTDEWVREDRKGRTLFDQSVQMTTTRVKR